MSQSYIIMHTIVGEKLFTKKYLQDDAFEPGNKLKILDRTLTVCD